MYIEQVEAINENPAKTNIIVISELINLDKLIAQQTLVDIITIDIGISAGNFLRLTKFAENHTINIKIERFPITNVSNNLSLFVAVNGINK